jgi:hypothetical protein
MEGHIVGYTASSGIYRVYTKDKKIITTKEPRHRESSGDLSTIEVPIDPNEDIESQGEANENSSRIHEDDIGCQGETGESTARVPGDGGTIKTLESPLGSEQGDENVLPPAEQPCRSTRIRRPPRRYSQEDTEHAYIVSASTPTVKKALAGPDSEAWMAAMEAEKMQRKKYGVYEELDCLPVGRQIVDTKWVLKEKYDRFEKLEKRKVRLIARRFTQISGFQRRSNHINQRYHYIQQ